MTKSYRKYSLTIFKKLLNTKNILFVYLFFIFNFIFLVFNIEFVNFSLLLVVLLTQTDTVSKILILHENRHLLMGNK